MHDILAISTALLLGAFVRAITGFGAALIAMPVMCLFISVQVAAPVQSFFGVIMSLSVLYKNRHALDLRAGLHLLIASLPGLPIGFLMLKFGSPKIVTSILGALLIAYAAFSLFAAPSLESKTSKGKKAYRGGPLGTSLAGFCSGVLGGAYAALGPPVVVYGVICRWDRDQFRSTMALFFSCFSTVIVVVYAAGGLITKDVLFYWLFGMPAVVLGLFLGFQCDKYVNARQFRTAVLALILFLGASLLYR